MKAYPDGDTMAVVTVGDMRLGSCCQLTLCNAVLLWRERTHTQSPMQGGFLGPNQLKQRRSFRDYLEVGVPTHAVPIC